MTEREHAEAIQLVRDHSSVLVHPLLDSIERMWQGDRLMIDVLKAQLALLDGVWGHRVPLDDNAQHSRRAGLRSAS